MLIAGGGGYPLLTAGGGGYFQWAGGGIAGAHHCSGYFLDVLHKLFRDFGILIFVSVRQKLITNQIFLAASTHPYSNILQGQSLTFCGKSLA